MKGADSFPVTAKEIAAFLGAGGFLGQGTRFAGVDGKGAFLWGLGIFFVCTLAVAVSRVWQDRRFRFRLRPLVRHREGDEVLEAVSAARQQLLLTHSSRFVPSDEYTGAVCAAIRRGLRVRRLIPQSLLADPEMSDWLRRFDHAASVSDRRSSYECTVLEVPEFPLSFALIDREHVFLWLPGSSLNHHHAEWIAEFENADLGSIFQGVFDALKDRFGASSQEIDGASSQRA